MSFYFDILTRPFILFLKKSFVLHFFVFTISCEEFLFFLTGSTKLQLLGTFCSNIKHIFTAIQRYCLLLKTNIPFFYSNHLSM